MSMEGVGYDCHYLEMKMFKKISSFEKSREMEISFI